MTVVFFNSLQPSEKSLCKGIFNITQHIIFEVIFICIGFRSHESVITTFYCLSELFNYDSVRSNSFIGYEIWSYLVCDL